MATLFFTLAIVVSLTRIFLHLKPKESERSYQFERKAYHNTIIAAQTDLSWDAKRKVERLCTEILKESRTKDNFIFAWASARINNNQITFCFSRNGEQKLFFIDWDAEDDKNVLENAARFLEQISHA
jgi:hypothetical protein